MLKRTFLALAGTALFGVTVLSADGGRGTQTPRTPAEIVASRVARLTVQLTLTTAQQASATTIFTKELTDEALLVTPLQTAHTALTAAIKANSANAISAQAIALGDLERQEILIDATAQAAFYNLLTAAQKTLYDNLRVGGFDIH
jgi:Spy/CpxP family protein refolding chaperone